MIEKMKMALTRQIAANTPQMIGNETLAPQSKPGIITSWLPMAVAANQRPIIRPAYLGGATLVTKLMPIGDNKSSAKVSTR